MHQYCFFSPNATVDWQIVEKGLSDRQLWWRPHQLNVDEFNSEFRIRATNAEGYGEYGMSKEEESGMCLMVGHNHYI